MIFTDPPTPRFRTPRRRVGRLAVAVAAVAATTLIRLAEDPLLGDRVPYFTSVLAIVVGTWFGGVEGGVATAVLSLLAAHYFFGQPRHDLIPTGSDWLAIGGCFVIGLVLIEVVARWRHAESSARSAHSQIRAVLEQMPVGVVIKDSTGAIQFANAACKKIFGVSPPAGRTALDWQREGNYVARHPDGRPMSSEEAPPGRALQAGETTVDEELQIVHGDGRIQVLSCSAAPLWNEEARRMPGAVVAMLDVTEQKRLSDETRIAKERYSRLFNLAREGFAHSQAVYQDSRIVDLRLLEMNPAGGQLSGISAEAQVGRTWREVWQGSDERLFAQYQRADETGASVRLDAFYGRTGRWHEMVISPLGHGEFLTTFNDVTERKEAEQELRDANRLKDEFLATLSHELRTPLNAIVGWSDMLRRGDLRPKDTQKAVESIYRNAKVQSEMINDVLDVSRIISGKVQIEAQPVDPATIMHNAVESVRVAAEARRVTITTDLAALPFPLSGDATRLQQVFWNLLSNAVKFTPSGGRVSVSLGLIDGYVRVRVADTGVGIPADFLPHVFGRFRQRDSSSTRTHSGLGLGLAIVKHLVELHGGTVKAESAGEGQGATFTVTLPARPFEERRRGEPAVVRRVAAVEPVPDDVPSLCGMRVLVVDDERDTREVAASVLRHHGANVAVAASSAQALDEFALFDPNVLLIDLAMPEMDGFSLIERVRTSSGPRGMQVPAIAFTAYAREEDRRRALASGFQLHVPKPVDSHALVRAVASVGGSRSGTID